VLFDDTKTCVLIIPTTFATRFFVVVKLEIRWMLLR